ncbi:hypothetical protein DXT91_28210 [Agrobacterium tumefaciens]|uniref:hypothetical protein n=1 Tax=Agrobacterium tumefaciens TaxID=358 RepID=UPI0012B8A7D5|nr:hypothetical protein [Agrobacterium tumefaciens]MQB07924.1 hypothetical protein [Agrobacterium tumefaciens]
MRLFSSEPFGRLSKSASLDLALIGENRIRDDGYVFAMLEAAINRADPDLLTFECVFILPLNIYQCHDGFAKALVSGALYYAGMPSRVDSLRGTGREK